MLILVKSPLLDQSRSQDTPYFTRYADSRARHLHPVIGPDKSHTLQRPIRYESCPVPRLESHISLVRHIGASVTPRPLTWLHHDTTSRPVSQMYWNGSSGPYMQKSSYDTNHMSLLVES